MRLPTVALLLLVGALPSIRLITDATPVPVQVASLQAGVCQGLECEDLRRNLPRAPPAPKAPEEGTPGGRPSDDPNAAPATFGGGEGGGGSPFGGVNERPPGSPEPPGAPEAAPAPAESLDLSLPQAVGIPHPPSAFWKEFSALAADLGPHGQSPVPRDKAVMYSGGMEVHASNWVVGADDGYVLLEDVLRNDWKSPSRAPENKDETLLLLDIQSAAFAAAASGEVKVFLPEEGLTSETVFSRVVWPQMVAPESGVTKITWVDDDDGTDVGDIWAKEQGPVPFELNKHPADMIP
ncbi:hypothetical protein BU16DRAFT_536590 [Lophium mytilinum]|uniref:Uncharacterized protein n=1 Tax=Lophium mytilinum TaxID=390894 RepID=A0A6A6R2I2_9PEZI|nr:hypothetical protein BU16DRAFT_536590 [Lophium mytilinum]